MEQQVALFNWKSLDTDTRSFVEEKTKELHMLMKRSAEDIIKIGKNLIDVKSRLQHGQFKPWLQSEFGMNYDTALNFMQVANRFGSKNGIIPFLPLSVLYALASPSMPETVIEMVEREEIPATLPAIREAKREIQREEQQTITRNEFLDEVFPGFTQIETIKDDDDIHLLDLPEQSESSDVEQWDDDEKVVTPQEAISESWTLPPSSRATSATTLHPILNTVTSKSNEWYTPARYVQAAREVMGGIDVDPASNPLANETVQAARFYDITTNGLDKQWHGRVWMNPPYGRDEMGSNQDVWTRRLIEQYREGITTEAVVLVNASVDTRWFQPLWDYLICFPDHRINFYTPEISASGSTHGSALVYLGHQKDKFINVFRRFGPIVRKVS